MDMVGGGGGGGSGWDAPSAVFAFGSPEKREEAVAKLRCQPALGAALPGGRDATHASASILEVSFLLRLQCFDRWPGSSSKAQTVWYSACTTYLHRRHVTRNDYSFNHVRDGLSEIAKT